MTALPASRRRLGAQVAAALLALATAAAAVTLPDRAAAAPSPTVSVILELRGGPSLAVKARPGATAAHARERAEQLGAAHASLLGAARDRGLEVHKQAEYRNVFNGVALEVPASQVAALRSLPGVVAVHPNVTYHATLDHSVPHVRAPEVWERTDRFGQPVRGTGQTVAVIDTGIDYHHPDLGGCLGFGCRVVGGFDFVNGDSDPDDDNGHGTHVAGIIGASGSVTGVAPDVELVAFKVLDQFGFGQTWAILAALDEATDPFSFLEADVVNLSLGAPGDGTDLVSQAVDRAAAAGYVVAVAAGNSGRAPIGSPAAAPGALTVGASITGVSVPRARLVAPRDYDLKASRMPFSANPSPGTVELDVVDVGRGRPADYEGVDVTGKAVLIATGQFPFFWFRDSLVAEQHGAAAALLAPPDPPDPFPTTAGGAADRRAPDQWRTGALASGDEGRLDSLVALRLPESAAADVQGMLKQGPARLAIEAVDATDDLASFSSRGPSGLLRGKPDLVAPGVDIRSTVPADVVGNPYFRISGTSMASPHVAGAAALLRQLHPGWSGQEVAAALTGSARLLDGGGPFDQGAGLLDVAAAADAKVTASPRLAAFELEGAGGAVDRSLTVTLTNQDSTGHDLDFRVVESTGTQAGVSVSPDRLHLVAGERATVRVRVTADDPGASLDATGWVRASIDGGGQLTIPYALSVRSLELFATPDPTVADSEVFVFSPAGLAGAPTVTVESPKGQRTTVVATHDHDRWWRAKVPGGAAGVHRVTASATTGDPFGGTRISGETAFEVLSDRVRKGPGWEPVGPYGSGGEMAPSPAGDGRMLVASERTASMFGTADGGRTWRQRSNLPLAGGSGFGAQPLLAADPTNPDRYYLGIDSGIVDPTYNGVLLVTDDQGEHWRRLPYPDARVFDLTVGAGGTNLAVLSDNALFLSTDRGQTWRNLWGPWSFATDVFLDGDDLYLATSDGLFAYRGVHGELSDPELLVQDPDEFGDGVRTVAARDGTVLAWPSSVGEPILRSLDRGATWEAVFTPPDEFMIAKELFLVGDDVWATSDRGVWVGADLGDSWSRVNAPLKDSVVGDADAFGGEVVLSADGGLYATGDGGASYRRIGVQGVDAHALALTRDASGAPYLVAGTTWDTYRTPLRGGVPPGPDWGVSDAEGDSAVGVPARFVETAPGNPRVAWKVVQTAFGGFKIFRSDDGGATWVQKKSGEQTPLALLVHPADPGSVYVAFRFFDRDQGLLITHDGGQTWRREPLDRELLALAGDPRDPSRVYAGDLDGFYLSTDAGRRFTRVHDIPTTAIAVDPRDPEHVVFGGRALWNSRDGAATAAPARYGPLELWVGDLAFGPRGTLYAATSSFYDAGLLTGGRGVLVSRDDGRSWRSMSAGLGSLDARSLAVAGDGRLYVGLGGGGVYATRGLGVWRGRGLEPR